MKDINSFKIGVFDSGIGGLTVLRKLTKHLPNEDYIYLGDNQNAPYGNKNIGELKRLVFSSLDLLLSCNVKVLVVACNTVSTTLKSDILARYKIPVVFTLPKRVEDAVLICTPNTARSSYVKENFTSNVVPLPMLASEIENNVFYPNLIGYKLDLKALPKNTKKLVLGCTHYIYLKDAISRETDLEVYDGLDGVVSDLNFTLKTHKLFSKAKKGKIEFVGDFASYNQKVYEEILCKNGL